MIERRKDSKGRVLRNGEVQRADGKYMFRYTDQDGKRQTAYSWKLVETDKVPEGKRCKEALRTMEKIILKDLDDGIVIGEGDQVSLNSMFEEFLEMRTDLKETTRANYICLYDKHVRDDFGRRKVGRTKYSDIYKFYMSLSKDTRLKKSSIQSINSIIWQLFEMATQDNLIRRNPSEGVMKDVLKRLQEEQAKRHALTIDQQGNLIDFIYSSEKYKAYGPLFTVLLGTGMRIGEALGLTWNDIDFKKNVIFVNHSLSYKSGENRGYEYHVSETKTLAGNRMIPMFQDVRKALQSEKRKATKGKFDPFVVDGYSNFVFLNTAGKVYTTGFIFDVIQNIVTDYNRLEMISAEKENREPAYLPKISAHIFRHTFCTRLCENEQNLKIIQDIMGHKNIRTTMEVYNEATAQAKQMSFSNLEGKIKLR